MPRHFPDWIKAYCDMLDGKTEAPRRFHFWSAVSCLAGAMTRKVVLDEVAFRYYPNFYIMLVSPPAVVKKTSTIDLSLSLLRELEGQVGHIKIGPDMTTVEGLCNFLAELNREVTTSDNSAMRVDTSWEAQCACTLSIGEFGSLYQSDNTALINLLTDLFDCRNVPLWKHTKTQGDDIIVNPFVNIIAGTTPRFLQDEFKDQVGGWGLSSRIIFVFAERKERSIYRPSKLLSGNGYDHNRTKLSEDLKEIAQLAGEFRFSADADRWSEQWYIRNEADAEQYVSQDSYSEWVAYFKGRKQVHLHKLAMVLSAARRNTLRIELDDIRDAAGHIEEVERDLPRAFEKKMTPTQFATTEQQILMKIVILLKDGPVPRNEVITKASEFVDSITARRLIESAIARRVISQEVKSNGGSWLKNGHVPNEH